jgi:cyclic pyranopterin phosphate synthase
MVDVSDKAATRREAVAQADVGVRPATLAAIGRRAIRKGDPLQAARLAGIMAAKRTADLVPLCHPLPLSVVEVDLTRRAKGYRIRARVATVAGTGVEMEALVAVAVAALTLYDMLKAIDKGIVIGPIVLLEKHGGRSGSYRRRP